MLNKSWKVASWAKKLGLEGDFGKDQYGQQNEAQQRLRGVLNAQPTGGSTKAMQGVFLKTNSFFKRKRRKEFYESKLCVKE